MNIKEKSNWIEEYGDDCYMFHSGIGDVCLGYVAEEENGRYKAYMYGSNSEPVPLLSVRDKEQAKKYVEKWAKESWENIKEEHLDITDVFVAEEGERISNKPWNDHWDKLMEKHKRRKRGGK